MSVSSASRGIFPIVCTMPSFSPSDSTTYYIGNIYITTNPVTSPLFRQCQMPFNCILVAADIAANTTTAGVTQESSTIAVRINNTTDITLSTGVQFQNNVLTFYPVTGLNTVFSAEDKWEIKWTTPAWATNPTSAVMTITLYFKPL